MNAIESSSDMKGDPSDKVAVWAKIIFATLCFLYTLDYFTHSATEIFFNNTNLILHEAGHLVFIFFGRFIYMAGGTIMQILIPTIFVIYFFLKKARYSAMIMLFWLAMSLFNVGVYAADAKIMMLPLLGGDSVIHDWNYLLTNLGLLNQSALIGTIWKCLGFVSSVMGIVGAILFSFKKDIAVEYADF